MSLSFIELGKNYRKALESLQQFLLHDFVNGVFAKNIGQIAEISV